MQQLLATLIVFYLTLGYTVHEVYADVHIWPVPVYALNNYILIVVVCITLVSLYFGIKKIRDITPASLVNASESIFKKILYSLLLFGAIFIMLVMVGSIGRSNYFLFGYIYKESQVNIVILLSFLLAILITIILEAISAFVLGYKKRMQQLALMYANLITNPTMNITFLLFGSVMNRASHYGTDTYNPTLAYFAQVPVVLFAEFTTIVIEYVLLRKYFGNGLKSFVKISYVNLISFVLGYFILQLLVSTFFTKPVFLPSSKPFDM